SNLVTNYSGTGALEGYDDTGFPTSITQADLLSVTYYDHYSFATDKNSIRPATFLDNPKNLVTGTKTRILGEDTFLRTVTFYDDRYRPIKVITDNHKGGQDIMVTSYTNKILPQVEEVQTYHTSDDYTGTLKVAETFTYDHGDRLLEQTHQITDNGSVKPLTKLVVNEYNEIGQLSGKNLHESTTGYAQEIDYEYNIRGWLTKINDGVGLTNEDQFGLQLHYETAGYYNGNIGRIDWLSKGGSSSVAQAFTYSYDPLNRLENANYSSAGKNEFFNVSNITYDANGNIMSLRRKRNNQTIDLLDYDYSGNQLVRVEDTGNDTDGFEDENSATGTHEYSYDANGNMVKDANKEIASISYNHLNLPQVVRFENGDFVKYRYDAAGIKLQKEARIGNATTVSDYVAGKHYNNGNMTFFQHAEGRVTKNGSSFDYEYHLTDHLGNVRVTVDEDGNPLQRDDYYPFGLTFNSWNGTTPVNQYQFNGNEMQLEIPNTADFNARFYDAALGRFMMIDPLADVNQESWNPYHFSYNNPIAFKDPTGLLGEKYTSVEALDSWRHEAQYDRIYDASDEEEKKKKESKDNADRNTKINFKEIIQTAAIEKLTKKAKPFIWSALKAEKARKQKPFREVESQGMFDAEVELNQSRGFTPIYVDIPGFEKPEKGSIAPGMFELNFELPLTGGKKSIAKGLYAPTGFKVDNTISRVWYDDTPKITSYSTPSGTPISGYLIKFTNSKGVAIFTIAFKEKMAYQALVKYLKGK
ncbi:MAG: RHS repeat-associated core domain-containing protein, partial [Bacteroidota bacterium]